MIKLSYRLSDEWNRKGAQLNLAQADEATLRYRAFLGDQIFVVNGVDFSAPWGWIPLLDFAASLCVIIAELELAEGDLVFEFTESEAELHFERQNHVIVITSNFNNGQAAVSLDELARSARSYAKSLIGDMMNVYPALKANISLRRWYPKLT